MKYEKIWSTTIYTAGDEGYSNFRIPAMITLPGGRVLAFAEGRSEHSDAGEINIVLRISDDGGRTFGPIKIVVAGNGNTAGNPSPAPVVKVPCSLWNTAAQNMSWYPTLPTLLTESC